MLKDFVPQLNLPDVRNRPCLITSNSTDLPYIGEVGDNLIVAVEGDHGVTLSDELGRLAARVAIDEEWTDTLPEEAFKPIFK